MKDTAHSKPRAPPPTAPASSNITHSFPSTTGVAGGLTNLSKMPACNIMLLGAQRKTLSGFSSTSVLPHTGYIYHSDIVQSLPPVSELAHCLQSLSKPPAFPMNDS